MFDVALYTDTRASEAIDGIDGFNFQAISEGMNAQDRQASVTRCFTALSWDGTLTTIRWITRPPSRTAGMRADTICRAVFPRVSPTTAAREIS